jgi:hypothetical protein
MGLLNGATPFVVDGGSSVSGTAGSGVYRVRRYPASSKHCAHASWLSALPNRFGGGYSQCEGDSTTHGKATEWFGVGVGVYVWVLSGILIWFSRLLTCRLTINMLTCLHDNN